MWTSRSSVCGMCSNWSTYHIHVHVLRGVERGKSRREEGRVRRGRGMAGSVLCEEYEMYMYIHV